MAQTITELILDGKDIAVTLTDSERDEFNQCEQIIANGWDTFLKVGWAMATITNKNLHREKYPGWTVERYFKEVWGVGKSRAYQQIKGYETVKLLESEKSTIVDFSDTPRNGAEEEMILPRNEAQARPLTRLKDPDDRIKAWKQVLQKLNDDPKARLTGALVTKTVKELTGNAAKKRVQEARKDVEATSLLSKQFKYTHQTLLDIIEVEKNTNWATSKRKEVVKWLKVLVKIAETDD